MDYAELAKRLREGRVCDHALGSGGGYCGGVHPRLYDEAADAIEALTSPPDEAQVDAALKVFVCTERIMFRVDPGSMALALDAAHRVRVKNEAKA